MATTKTLNTRLQLKYDSYANWSTNNPVLLAGEVAIATVPTDDTNNISTSLPAVLMKVGDGESHYNALPFLSAKAADVHAYAKKPEAEFIAWIKEIISTEGAYDAKGSAAQALVDAKAYTDTLANGAVKANTDAISAIKDGATIDSFADVEAELAKKQNTIPANTYDAYGSAATAESNAKEYTDALANGAVKANTDAIAAIKDGDSIDSFKDVETALAGKEVAGAAADALAEAKQYADGKDEAIAAAKKAGDDAQSDVDALETDMGNVDGLSTTNKTVVGAINEVLAAVGTGGTAAVVTVTTDTTTEGALKSYTIKQGDATVGVIDIPKDMVVESGEVVTNPEGQAEGTYIKLVLANVAEPLFINVGTLVDIYKAKANATQVQVAIDPSTREISATIVAGSIGTTELADNAVTTAKIADGNVTKAKLSTSVQASLDKADSAVQEVAEGTTNGTIAVDGTDVAVHGLGSAAYTDASAYDEAGAAATAKSEAITAAQNLDNEVKRVLVGTQADASSNDDSIWGAKKYADVQRGNAESYTDEQVEYLETEVIAPVAETANSAVQTVTAAADSGLKATRTGNDIAIEIDDSVTFIFDCGTSKF